jgi:hypothetical protein
VVAFASVNPSAVPAALPVFVSRSNETTADASGAGRETDHAPRQLLPAGSAGSPQTGQPDPVVEAPAPVLPLGAGLLAEGVLSGVATLGRAVKALVEPGAAEGRRSGWLFWTGVSSWLVAVGLAGEAARRYLSRRAQERPALPLGPADLPSEANT